MYYPVNYIETAKWIELIFVYMFWHEITCSCTIQYCKRYRSPKNKGTAILCPVFLLPSVLWCCWLGGRKCIQLIKNWWGAGMVICLGQGADLHIAQLMPQPLTVSCSSKSRLVLPILTVLTFFTRTTGLGHARYSVWHENIRCMPIKWTLHCGHPRTDW